MLDAIAVRLNRSLEVALPLLDVVVLFAQFGVRIIGKFGQIGLTPSCKVWSVSHCFFP